MSSKHLRSGGVGHGDVHHLQVVNFKRGLPVAAGILPSKVHFLAGRTGVVDVVLSVQVAADVLAVKEQVRVRTVGGQHDVNPAFNVLRLLEIVRKEGSSRVVVLPHHHEPSVNVVGAVVERHPVVKLEDRASRGEGFDVHPKRHRVGFTVAKDEGRGVVQSILQQGLPGDAKCTLCLAEAILDKREAVVVDGLVAGGVEHGGSVKICSQRRRGPIRHRQGTRPVDPFQLNFGRVAQLQLDEVAAGQRRRVLSVRAVHRCSLVEVRRGRGGQHEQRQHHQGDNTV